MAKLPDIPELKIERRQSVLFVTLNRPEAKNALNAAIVDGLMSLWEYLPTADDVRAVVLRGAGGAFCAGGDIKDFGRQLMAPAPAPGAEDPVRAGNRAFGDLLSKMDAAPQVLISLVEGPAFGGAMGFLSVSDVVIAGATAKFSLSETTLGLPPAQIGPFVVRKIGLFNARRLALTGARFDAEEALRSGLVDSVVAETDLDPVLAAQLTAIGRCEPAALAATKAILNRAAFAIEKDQLDDAADAFCACLRGAGRDGAAAFAAKQQPPWVETYSTESEV